MQALRNEKERDQYVSEHLVLVILKQGTVEGEFPPPYENTMREMLTHDQKCENQKCKENGLDQLKVVDVEYV